MGIDPKRNLKVGILPSGPRNLISDVDGVTVGHLTLAKGEVQTGVTAVRPHPGNLFREKVPAACHVINGFGKSMGLVQLGEMGTIETPILLTNTLNAGTAYTAMVRRALAENPEIGDTTGTINPIIGECNDGRLNDIRGLHVTEEHVFRALDSCSNHFAEGAVGAGRGMVCHDLGGGIGSASRLVEIDGETYTLGALLLTNHGKLSELEVLGDPLGQRIEQRRAGESAKGSCIVLLATDLPLSVRQLGRLCRRAVVGLGRTGSYIDCGSGEIAIAFSTAHRVPHFPQKAVTEARVLHDDYLDGAFRAVAEAVEESALSSMLSAEELPGRAGKSYPSLTEYFPGI